MKYDDQINGNWPGSSSLPTVCHSHIGVRPNPEQRRLSAPHCYATVTEDSCHSHCDFWGIALSLNYAEATHASATYATATHANATIADVNYASTTDSKTVSTKPSPQPGGGHEVFFVPLVRYLDDRIVSRMFSNIYTRRLSGLQMPVQIFSRNFSNTSLLSAGAGAWRRLWGLPHDTPLLVATFSNTFFQVDADWDRWLCGLAHDGRPDIADFSSHGLSAFFHCYTLPALFFAPLSSGPCGAPHFRRRSLYSIVVTSQLRRQNLVQHQNLVHSFLPLGRVAVRCPLDIVYSAS